jgi:hypothetical protein
MIDSSASPPLAQLSRVAGMGRAAGIGWLAFISAFALIDHVALSRFKATASTTGDTELTALQGRVAAVEHTVETLRRQPAPVSAPQLEAMRSALVEQLAPLEQLSKMAASKDDFAAVQARLSALETRLLRLKQTQQAARRGATATPSANAPEPPFAVLGVELRGGERFLSVAPLPVSTLGQVRLVRVGDQLRDLAGGWRLEALEGATAVFRSEGRLARINIP